MKTKHVAIIIVALAVFGFSLGRAVATDGTNGTSGPAMLDYDTDQLFDSQDPPHTLIFPNIGQTVTLTGHGTVTITGGIGNELHAIEGLYFVVPDTVTVTATETGTYSVTGTGTGTATGTSTVTSTKTTTQHWQYSFTETSTDTRSVTYTATSSYTASAEGTATGTVTITDTVTGTVTGSATNTLTATGSASGSITSTCTVTGTTNYTGTGVTDCIGPSCFESFECTDTLTYTGTNIATAQLTATATYEGDTSTETSTDTVTASSVSIADDPTIGQLAHTLVLPNATRTITNTTTIVETDFATTTPAASKVPIAGTDSKLDIGWLPSSVTTGSGTANYMTKWSDSSTLANSVVYDDGTGISIGGGRTAAVASFISSGGAAAVDFRYDNSATYSGGNWASVYGSFEIANRDQTNGNVEYMSFSGHPVSGGSSAVIGAVNIDHAAPHGAFFIWTRNGGNMAVRVYLDETGMSVGQGGAAPTSGSVLDVGGNIVASNTLRLLGGTVGNISTDTQTGVLNTSTLVLRTVPVPGCGSCYCSGTGPAGNFSVRCGEIGCGTDLKTYSCSGSGWTQIGDDCTENIRICDTGYTEPGLIASTDGYSASYVSRDWAISGGYFGSGTTTATSTTMGTATITLNVVNTSTNSLYAASPAYLTTGTSTATSSVAALADNPVIHVGTSTSTNTLYANTPAYLTIGTSTTTYSAVSMEYNPTVNVSTATGTVAATDPLYLTLGTGTATTSAALIAYQPNVHLRTATYTAVGTSSVSSTGTTVTVASITGPAKSGRYKLSYDLTGNIAGSVSNYCSFYFESSGSGCSFGSDDRNAGAYGASSPYFSIAAAHMIPLATDSACTYTLKMDTGNNTLYCLVDWGSMWLEMVGPY